MGRTRITSHKTKPIKNEAGLEKSRVAFGKRRDTISHQRSLRILLRSAILTYPVCFPDKRVSGSLQILRFVWQSMLNFHQRVAKAVDLSTFALLGPEEHQYCYLESGGCPSSLLLQEQHEIVRRVEELFALGDRIETRYQKAKGQVDKLTQSILAKAFRGDLSTHDPNDQPASELLKRIKAQKVEDSHSKGLKKTKKRSRHNFLSRSNEKYLTVWVGSDQTGDPKSWIDERIGFWEILKTILQSY